MTIKTIKEEMRTAKQTVPLPVVLSRFRFSTNFQHVFDGFICEAQG